MICTTVDWAAAQSAKACQFSNSQFMNNFGNSGFSCAANKKRALAP